MRKLQMVDLKSQYDKIKDTVNASIQEVLDTTTYINGPLVHEFQKSQNFLLRCDERICRLKRGRFSNQIEYQEICSVNIYHSKEQKQQHELY